MSDARAATASARPLRERAHGPQAAADFEAATTPHYGPLVRRLTLVLGNLHDAEDVAQEAYLRAFRSWDRFDGRDIRGWLFTIGLRLAFNQLRRRRRWRDLLGRGEPEPWMDRHDPDLWDALSALDARTRAAILLTQLDGYTQREAAVMLEVPEGTLASWVSRGRMALRARLGGVG